MHFSNWTKRFFLLQGSDILIGALHFLSFEAYESGKTNSPFSEMGYSFSEEHTSLFSKRAVRFFTDSYKVVGISLSSIGESS